MDLVSGAKLGLHWNLSLVHQKMPLKACVSDLRSVLLIAVLYLVRCINSKSSSNFACPRAHASYAYLFSESRADIQSLCMKMKFTNHCVCK